MKEAKTQVRKSTVKKSSKKKLLAEELAARILEHGATLHDCLEWLNKHQKKAVKKNNKVEQEIIGKMKYYIKAKVSE